VQYLYQYSDYARGWTTGVRVPAGSGEGILPSHSRPDRLCDPPGLLSNGYWGILLRE